MNQKTKFSPLRLVELAVNQLNGKNDKNVEGKGGGGVPT